MLVDRERGLYSMLGKRSSWLEVGRTYFASTAQASVLSRVDAMLEGFETVVGERQLKLSGGERQRIAIARALYDEHALLVLDEASSALADQTERQIMDGLRDLADRLTIIAVTHRTSMIRPGDQIAHIDAAALLGK
ncbi:ATP-binding cassette domain-containing protein [Beijerinckia sp. L45]|uniref:ATP-binding cassette domain-containing protein n=1 Tax=Beijerinckia sp. L45 TaxID=1641855 RepID=UPI0034CD6EA0